MRNVSRSKRSRTKRPITSLIGRKHPPRDVISSGQNLAKECHKMITSHDVLEPLKLVLLASRDVIISSQICGSKLHFFHIR